METLTQFIYGAMDIFQEGLARFREEYGISVIFVDESHTSSTCPIHGDSCEKRVTRGLFRCTKLNKVFNADLIDIQHPNQRDLHNPKSRWDRGNEP